MSGISPLGQNTTVQPKQLKLEDVQKMDDVSIWNAFDTDNSKTISDKEISALGFVKQAFNDVKYYLKQRFGSDKIINTANSDGYFDYNVEESEVKVLKSLDELELRNGCCYDVRGYDISGLDISEEQLLNLTIDKTTVMSDAQKKIVESYIEKTKDPGLGIKQLHEQGITGKGVRMAIIDQPLGKHQEYSSNIVGKVHDVNTTEVNNGWSSASMHGAAVASIAVGKNVGVAPEADLVYYSAINISEAPEDIAEYKANVEAEIKKGKKSNYNINDLKNMLAEADRMGAVSSNKPYVEAIKQILKDNENAKDNEKVSVISISWGFDPLAPGFKEYQEVVKEAKAQGVFIVSTRVSDDYTYTNSKGKELPMNTCGANRNPQGDLNDYNDYEAGAFFKSVSEKGKASRKNNLLLVPMDHRTVADFTDGTSYRYEGNDGGMSWSTPWLAGMYVLAKQTDKNITPEMFWQYAMETSDECKNNDSGKYVGRIVNPQKLIEMVQQNKERKDV